MTAQPTIDVETLLAQAGWMRRLVVRLLDDPDAVEDVVQETWVRALEQPPRAASELHSLRKWLHTVARRLALRRNMSEAARRRREAAVAYRTDVASSGDEAALGAERIRQQRVLAGHVLALEEPYRTAVILRYQEGLSPARLAKRLGISNAAGRQRVSRGLAKLRQKLDREHGRRSTWSAAFALLALRPGQLHPPSPMAATMAKAGLGIAGILAVATATWALLESPATASLPEAAARKNRRILAGGEAGPRVGVSDTARIEVAGPGPSLLATVDRKLDLHGVVVDPEQRPVEGAVVEALLPDRSAVSLLGRRLGEPGFEGLRTRTNRLGEFVLRLSPGWSVDLSVTAAPFAGTLLPDLLPGEKIRVQLEPAIRLRGRITRSDESPIGEARLRLTRLYRGQSRFREIGCCSTDRAGAYSFSGLRAGRYLLDIAAGGASDRRTIFDIAADEFDAVRDVELDAGLLVKGRVIDAVTRERIAGARVVAARSFSRYHRGMARVFVDPEIVGLGWSSHASVRTDALGEFEIVAPEGLMPPQVIVIADGYARLQRRIDAPSDEPLEISLARGYRVEGRCVNAAGEPVEEVAVSAMAHRYMDGMPHGDWRTARTGADGRFVLTDLRSDLSHLILMRGRGYGEVSRAVERGANASLGDIVLRPQASISGRALGSDGKPRRGLYVLAAGLEGPGEPPPGPNRHYSRTDDLGRFRISGLGAGTYRLGIYGQRPSDTIQVLDGEEQSGLEILVPGLDIAGRVTDVYGVPVPRAAVLVLDARSGRAKRQPRTTKMDGRFRFRAVPAGSYTIRVVPNSIHELHGLRMVHGVDQPKVLAGDLNVSIILPPAELITGKLFGADGKPLARTMVFARNDAGELLTYESTDGDGEFLLRLPPGTRVDLQAVDKASRPLVRGVLSGRRGLSLTMPGVTGRGH